MPSILPTATPLSVYSEIIRNLGSISAILAITPYDAQSRVDTVDSSIDKHLIFMSSEREPTSGYSASAEVLTDPIISCVIRLPSTYSAFDGIWMISEALSTLG